MTTGNQKAPDGAIWVCGACGKTNYWRYGFDDQEKNTGPDMGWDESCMMKAVLVHEESLVRDAHGRVCKADPWEKQ